MKTTIKDIGLLITIVAVLGIGIGWGILQWYECRAMSHSFLYCLGHVFK